MQNGQTLQSASGNSLLDKVGIPKQLAWGYLGILIFMMV